MPQLTRPKMRRGFTIIEVVVSIAILVLALGGAMALIILTREAENSAQNASAAAYLASEGQELVRYVRDANINNGSDPFLQISETDSPYTYSFAIDDEGAGSIIAYPSGLVRDAAPLKLFEGRYQLTEDPAAEESLFRRLITTTYHPAAGVQPAYLDVRSEVSWEWDGKKHDYTLTSQLAAWR